MTTFCTNTTALGGMLTGRFATELPIWNDISWSPGGTLVITTLPAPSVTPLRPPTVTVISPTSDWASTEPDIQSNSVASILPGVPGSPGGSSDAVTATTLLCTVESPAPPPELLPPPPQDISATVAANIPADHHTFTFFNIPLCISITLPYRHPIKIVTAHIMLTGHLESCHGSCRRGFSAVPVGQRPAP